MNEEIKSPLEDESQLYKPNPLGTQHPEVLFVDPNRDLIVKGADLLIPPEDYCIAVQLEVAIPQLDGYNTRDAVTVEMQSDGNKKPTMSFFTGKYVGDQYILTDYFQDISFHSESVAGGGETEALGIRSINIEYNSWYLPQVSIEFVDVRGMALMNPVDAFKKGSIENAINSFFSAFYMIPYPQFKLLVKGFYGNSTTYDLAAQDIRTTLDPQTGNVIISAQFVGFTFAMFADIPFDWIKSAPYNKYAQDDEYSYWTQQIENGRFVFDEPSEGIKIPTFAELYEIIQTSIRSVEKLNQEDTSAKKFNNLHNAQLQLESLQNKFNQFKRDITKQIEPNNKPESYIIGFDDVENGNLTIFSQITNAEDNKIKTWTDFFIDPNGIPFHEQRVNEIKSAVEAYNQMVISGELEIPIMTVPTLELETLETHIPNNEDNDTYIKDNNFRLKSGIEYNHFVLNYFSFKTEVEKIIKEDIEKGKTQSKQDLLNKTYELVKESVGFVPTIGNIVKLFFAHFEMFFYNYFSVISKTKQRKCEEVAAPPDLIDANNDGKSTAMLPPWFGIQTSTYEGSIKCWPGSEKVRGYFKTPDTWKELEEVKFLKYYNESIIEYNKRISQVAINLSQLNDENVWLPVNPFDVSNTVLITGIHEVNPYKQIIEDSSGIDIINDIIKEVGVRMFYGVATWDEKGSAYDVLAKAEAKNVFSVISEHQAIVERLKEYLNKNLTADEMVKIWEGNAGDITNEKGNNTNSIKDRTGNTLLSSDSDNKGLYTMLQYSFKNNANGFVVPFASIGLSNYNDGDRQVIDSEFNFQINEGVPLFYTHSERHNSTWGGKYKVIFNIQPYYQSIDTFMSRVVGMDETGKDLIRNWDLKTNRFTDFFVKELTTVGGRKGYNENYFTLTEEIEPEFPKQPIYYTNLTKDKDNTRVVGNLTVDKTSKKDQPPPKLDNYKPDIPLFNKNSGLIMDLDRTVNNRGNKTGFVLPYFEIDGKNIFCDDEYYKYNMSNSQSLSESNYKKSVIFLWSLGINDEQVFKYLDDNFKFSCLKRLPKVVLLYLGANCWAKENGKFSFKSKNYNPKIDDLKIDIIYILQKYFKEWVNKTAIHILEKLELTRNGQAFSSNKDLKGACTEIISKINKDHPYLIAKDVFSVLGDKICDTYCGVHFVNGNIEVLLDPTSSAAQDVMELMGKDDLVISTYYQIFGKNTPRNMKVTSASGYADTFLTRLKELVGLGTDKDNTDPDKPNEITNNEEMIYATKYYQFKKIYDRWVSWDDSKFEDWKLERFYNNKRSPENPAAITIIDKFYCDISNLLICNLDEIGKIIEDINEGEMTLLSVISNLFGKHKMLFVPTPNKVGFRTKEELLDVFKPYTYRMMDKMRVQPGYTAIYTGEAASQPTLGDSGKGGKLKDDTLQILGKDSPENGIPGIPPEYGNVRDAGKIPVFCVSYGKQNQSYFQLASLTNTNPIVTEQTTRATENIAQMMKSDGTESKHGGQDLYNVYSANAYTVDVQMMGCAKIMPLMYFQLNNVYLFTGAYMIFKMKHQITPGKMVTTFTGIKQTVNRQELTKNPFFAQTLIDDSYDKQENYKAIEPTPKEETNPPTPKTNTGGKFHLYGPASWVAQISDETTIDYAALKSTKVSKYYTLANCVEASDTNKQLAGSWDKAGEDMPPGIHENLKAFMPQVDEVRDWVRSEGKYTNSGMCQKYSSKLLDLGFSNYPKDYNIHLESVWRRYNNNDLKWYQTFHGYGCAADIHLLYKSNKAEKRHPVYEFIYNFIEDTFPNQITELYYEICNTSRWVHYAWTPSSNKNQKSRNFKAC